MPCYNRAFEGEWLWERLLHSSKPHQLQLFPGTADILREKDNSHSTHTPGRAHVGTPTRRYPVHVNRNPSTLAEGCSDGGLIERKYKLVGSSSCKQVRPESLALAAIRVGMMLSTGSGHDCLC